MTTLSLHSSLTQTTAFSPRLQHAVRLLHMSTLDYAQALQEAAQENPFLEVEEAENLAPAGPEDATAARGEAELEWAHDLDRMAQPSATGQRLAEGEGFDLLQQAPVPASLRAHLHGQLGVLRLDARERALAGAVVEALDDDGYLRISLEELEGALGHGGDLSGELRTALCRVQALDPVGVAARSLGECLLLQMDAVADAELRQLARRIVCEHLELLAARKMQRLASLLGVGETQLQQAVACILRLEPRPGAQFGDAGTRYVVPDVIVRKVGGAWKTALNRAALPRVRVHQSYAELFEQHRGADDAAMKTCLDRARWTVNNASQRASTILDIAGAIVARQRLFLEYGHLAMKPLGLREVADAVGVHPSTVSRAVHHKYLATPHGVFELHHFFSRGMAHARGGDIAPVALQTLIRELIASESKAAPWSDAALARELGQQGFRIARRTVTKYRQGMRIEAVERRCAG